MNERARTLIAALEMQPHPEGGYYREIYRSPDTVQPQDGRGERSALTTIYFLLTAGQVSRWHRVLSDEVWHHYEGDPLELLWLSHDLTVCHRAVLGPVREGVTPVATVPAGCWQAARPTGDHTLVGCTVGPGFDFHDFTLISPESDIAPTIRTRFPHLASLI